MRSSPPNRYIGKASSGELFEVQIHIELDESISRGKINPDFRAVVEPTRGGDHMLRETNKNHPFICAWFNSQQYELHVESILKGYLIPNQRFASTTFSHFLHLVPTAKSIYLANVLHKKTADLIIKSLSGGIPATILDDMEDPGSLVKALLSAGLSRITAVREGNSAFIGLRAYSIENAPYMSGLHLPMFNGTME